MELGQRISALRKLRGMTQEQLAEQLGTTRQAISKWESGKSEPDINSLIHMGALFEVSMDELVLGKKADTPGTHTQSGPQQNIISDSACRSYRRYRLYFVILAILGECMVLLLPLMAFVYKAHMYFVGQIYNNPLVYLTEWPLLGVVLIAVSLFIGGIVGALWMNKKYDNLKAKNERG